MKNKSAFCACGFPGNSAIAVHSKEQCYTKAPAIVTLDPVKKFYRVSWLEKYEKVFAAVDEDAAIENRDDEDAFISCEEVTAQEVRKCKRAAPSGSRDCFGCGQCESGWSPVVEKQPA